jgi:hypothetical protein
VKPHFIAFNNISSKNTKYNRDENIVSLIQINTMNFSIHVNTILITYCQIPDTRISKTNQDDGLGGFAGDFVNEKNYLMWYMLFSQMYKTLDLYCNLIEVFRLSCLMFPNWREMIF